jgi:hypothetical protein
MARRSRSSKAFLCIFGKGCVNGVAATDTDADDSGNVLALTILSTAMIRISVANVV